jgi:hypothetical protein
MRKLILDKLNKDKNISVFVKCVGLFWGFNIMDWKLKGVCK